MNDCDSYNDSRDGDGNDRGDCGDAAAAARLEAARRQQQCCGAGRDWPAWSLDTLAAALLIRRFGFSGAEAAAWVLMVAS